VGTVIAVFLTVDGRFRYAVDTEGYGALQSFAEEKLVVHLHKSTKLTPMKSAISPTFVSVRRTSKDGVSVGVSP
jgi:hypothetical protein